LSRVVVVFDRLHGCRTRLAALPPNRAVFEVLDLIAETMGMAWNTSDHYELARGRGSSQGTGSTQ
jgi:hypothetical protein